ncbi:MAG: winged helix-turn-helix transcriptional regulator, partial [Acidobacteriia bacterium]|nr:winged helix-turn-helix transcriptional regulator [Terriglobia bacterium]
IAAAAALFGDPARAAMLIALLDRPVLSAGELALAANVSPQTASFHLAKLKSAALLLGVRRGRNHVYRLAGPAVANAIESLAAVSPAVVSQPLRSDRFRSDRMRQLRAARTCYDHLAGLAGVSLHDCLLARGYLEVKDSKEYVPTTIGREWFCQIGGTEGLLRSRSPFARRCIDWSEQRPHLAGRLAAFLLDRFFAERWIARIPDTRAVRITDRGLRDLERQYGIDLKTARLLP